MKKLLLINPVGRRSGYLLSKVSTFAPLGLAYVAAVTPSNWDVKILDENCTPFEFEEADLVGITAFTSNINRAYEITKMYRDRKIKVILGGIHASMVPDEALQYADAVVIGEVEGIWEKVIHDFENNCLAATYMGPQVDLQHYSIMPRRDLLDPSYLWQSVQTSRGCPFNCHFCSVSRYLGKAYRQRTAQSVLEELAGIDSQHIAFMDDNLVGYSKESKERAMELFGGMIDQGLNKKWWTQTSINAAEDEEIVKLAAQSGCIFVFIGFETTSSETLQTMKKGVNLKTGVDNYKRVVDTFHKYGIGVFGAFIIGNDYESPHYYRELADFMVRSGIDVFQISILTPLPGTQLMEQLQEENRLIHDVFPADWDKYRLSYVVHQTHGIDVDTVYMADNYIKNRLYSPLTNNLRLLKSFIRLKDPTTAYTVYRLNKSLKTSWRNSHYYNKYPHTLG